MNNCSILDITFLHFWYLAGAKFVFVQTDIFITCYYYDNM